MGHQQAQQMLGGDSSAGRDCERSIRDIKLIEESKTKRLLQTSRGVREATEEEIKKHKKSSTRITQIDNLGKVK